MRLIEFLLKSRPAAGSSLAPDLPLLRDATLVVADNVELMLRSQTRDAWEPGDFPNIAPPLDNMFIEWRDPSGKRLTGIHVLAFEQGASIMGDDLESRWQIVLRPYSWFAEEARLITIWEFAYGLNVAADGGMSGPLNIAPLSPAWETDDRVAAAGRNFGTLCATALMTISLMHCKNVIVTEHGPHLRHAGSRNRRGPQVKYHLLEIEPMKKVLQTEGQSETAGYKKAVHICRGHFATYTDEHPLFGKYTGSFWKPMHVRGNAAQGEVIKHYQVNAPGARQ